MLALKAGFMRNLELSVLFPAQLTMLVFLPNACRLNLLNDIPSSTFCKKYTSQKSPHCFHIARFTNVKTIVNKKSGDAA
jgi:hypothetical protein